MQNVVTIFIIIAISMSSFAQEMSRNGELGHSIDKVSYSFMGLPYLTDPLGEGFGQDKDPIYRFDGFDCTTFVETVLALAKSRTFNEFEDRILKIRYSNGVPDFVERNHFTDADWIPNNIQKGFFKDITNQLNFEFFWAEASIDKSSWLNKIHKINRHFELVTAKVPYISLVSLFKNPRVLNQIPSGSVMNVVRPNWNIKNLIGTNMNISHQGFIIRKPNNQLYFRHASQKYLKIVEEPLLQYLKWIQSEPSIQGINILEPI